MPKRLKAILQYLLILGITFFLIWFSLRGLSGDNKWEIIRDTWQSADKVWLGTMALLAVISHAIRAERWRLLLKPAGQKTTFTNSFLSLMVGYLVNLVIPRGGEVSRCYNLYRLNDSPVEVTFGTVVVERIIDLICLLTLIIFAFVFESEKLFEFLKTLPFQASTLYQKIKVATIVLIAIGVIIALVYLILKRSKRLSGLVKRIIHGFKNGLSAIFKLEKKGLFVLYSVSIWLLYFLMSYAVINAFEQTSHLGWTAVLSLFAIGSIAMAAPLPGGTGSYHALVPAGLTFLYGVEFNGAVAFTFVFHGWQTFIMIVTGAISLIITHVLVLRKNSQKPS
jgi:uncharacterized protein (TIRG00374 family)